MPSRRSFRALCCLLGVTSFGVVLAARPGGMAVPRDYFARLDGTLTTALGHDGRTWSVWSYRAVGEYDVAIAVRDLDGTWSPATFLGRRDGVDQVEPSIAVDADGNVYVAFATRSPQRIWTSVLPSGRSTWSEPSILALDEAATAPALRVVRDRLVIAVRSARGIRMIDLPLYVAPNTDQGIQDGPDTQGPLGNEGRDLPIGDGPSGDPPPPPPPPGDGASSNS